MEAEGQKLAELNAHCHYETFDREHVRHAEIEASRKRLEARGQRHRSSCSTAMPAHLPTPI
jgi:hypothetical protein